MGNCHRVKQVHLNFVNLLEEIIKTFSTLFADFMYEQFVHVKTTDKIIHITIVSNIRKFIANEKPIRNCAYCINEIDELKVLPTRDTFVILATFFAK